MFEVVSIESPNLKRTVYAVRKKKSNEKNMPRDTAEFLMYLGDGWVWLDAYMYRPIIENGD